LSPDLPLGASCALLNGWDGNELTVDTIPEDQPWFELGKRLAAEYKPVRV